MKCLVPDTGITISPIGDVVLCCASDSVAVGHIKDINNKLATTQTTKLNYRDEIANYKNSKTIYTNSQLKLNIGSISKYQNLTDKYMYLSADLSKNQEAFKLFSDQVDLINSLGGVYKTKEQLKK